MDTFFEQIVPIKKTAKDFLLLILIWIAAGFVAFLAFSFLIKLFAFAVAAAGLVFYGAFRLSKMLFVEYEYIVTNGTMDIDKITAKSSRKRVMSFEICEVNEIEKYNPSKPIPNGVSKSLVACDKDSQNAYSVVVLNKNKEKQFLVFTPNERIIEGMKKSLPKFISNSAFK